MPVTKTAKRASRNSRNKSNINKNILAGLDIAFKKAKKTKDPKNIRTTISLLDKAAKKKVIHKNKAARIKSSLSRFMSIKK